MGGDPVQLGRVSICLTSPANVTYSYTIRVAEWPIDWLKNQS